MQNKEIKQIVAIHQPCYWPWLGLIQKMLVADIFILLDDVQFNRRAFQHRTYIKIQNKKKYLTLPVHSEKHQILNLLIKDTLVKSEEILKEHWDLICQFYSKSPDWHKYCAILEEVYKKNYTKLIDINVATLEATKKLFNIKNTEFMFSGSFSNKGNKEELIINLCKAVGGNIYFSGIGAKDYQSTEEFIKNGIEIIYQDFKHPVYNQINENFESGCAGFDLPLNDGNVLKNFMQNSLILKNELKKSDIEVGNGK